MSGLASPGAAPASRADHFAIKELVLFIVMLIFGGVITILTARERNWLPFILSLVGVLTLAVFVLIILLGGGYAGLALLL